MKRTIQNETVSNKKVKTFQVNLTTKTNTVIIQSENPIDCSLVIDGFNFNFKPSCPSSSEDSSVPDQTLNTSSVEETCQVDDLAPASRETEFEKVLEHHNIQHSPVSDKVLETKSSPIIRKEPSFVAPMRVVQVECQGKPPAHFKIGMHHKVGRICQLACKKFGVAETACRFVEDGNPLIKEETIAQLFEGIPDDDLVVVDMLLEQPAG